MYSLKTENDGKEKHQSWEAKLVDAFGDEHIIEWGSTEKEAINNLKVIAQQQIKSIKKALDLTL